MKSNRKDSSHPLHALALLVFANLILVAGAWADVPTSLKPVSIGLGGYAYWSSSPFANTVLSGGNWIEYGEFQWGSEVFIQNIDGSPNPQFDDNGCPRFLNPGRKLRLLVWPNSVGAPVGAPPAWPDRGITGLGKWVVTWQGDADIRLQTGTFLPDESSGGATGSLVNGRRVYQVASDPIGHITVEAINAANPITDIKIWLPDPANPQGQSLESAGSIWHPSFLAAIASADFNHLRFMDWNDTNGSPQQDWGDRRRPGFVMQGGVLNRRSPAAGIPLWTDGSGTSYYADGNRPTGLAYEHMVALCNITGKDMWICVPHLATDDYVTKLANLLRYGSDGVNPYTSPQANPIYPPLDPSRKVWVEYSNEIWSNGPSFPQGNWAAAQGAALGFTADAQAKFNARRYAQIWRIFQQQFDGSSRLVRVAAIFTAVDSYTIPFLNELKAYGATLSPAVSVDAVAPTTYFGNGIQDWAYEQANLNAGTADQWFHTASSFVHDPGTGATRPVSVPLADPYWSSDRLAGQQSATFVEWKKRIFSGSGASGGGPDSTGVGGGFSSSLRANIFSIFGQHLPIVAYEGGPSLYTDYVDGGNERDDGLANFCVALNRRPMFAEIYRIQLNMARAKGLAAHSMFTDVGAWGKYGQWGHLEYPGQPLSSSVKWSAVQAWSADMAGIRPIDDVLGTKPAFVTAGTLPIGLYNTAYSHDVVVSGGEGTPVFTVIGRLLDSGISLAAVPNEPNRYRVSGTPTQGGWNYFYLRVQDADGDASWQIFSLYIAGGPGTVVESDPRGVFAGSSGLPWTNVHTLDPAVTWSGLQRGATYVSSGGSALAPGAVNYPDGTGVELFSATDAIRFAMNQGSNDESDSTLASAITDNEYWTFSVTPQPGQLLNLRDAEFKLSWRRETYHSSRKLAVMASLGGFAEGQQVYTLATTPDSGAVTETVFKLPNTAAYNNLTAPIEFRIYFYGGQYGGSHPTSLLGVKITRAAGAIPTPYQTWVSGQSWNGADSSPAADPNSDGISNLMAYALNTASLEPANTAHLPRFGFDSLQAGGPWLTVIYRKNPAASDLSYTVRASANLATWTNVVPDNVNAFLEIADPDPDGDSSAVLMRLRLKHDPATTPRKFLQLFISQ